MSERQKNAEGIASQEIYKKSSKKIYKKWTSSTFDFAAIRFSAGFFIFDFSSDFLRSNPLRPIEISSTFVFVGFCGYA